MKMKVVGADEFKKETILPMRESQTRKHCATDKLLGMVTVQTLMVLIHF